MTTRIQSSAFSRLAVFVAAALLACAPILASPGDWPSWRGPAATGWVGTDPLPTEWSASEGLCWSTELPGPSAATPIIVGDRIFLSVGLDDSVELWAISRTSGEKLWSRAVAPSNEETRKQDMSSPSSAVEGDLVVTLTGTGVLRGFTVSGDPLWTRDLTEDYGDFGLMWGYASSPLLEDGVAYVQVLHGMRTDDPSYVLAVDARTGETKWRVERQTDAKAESPDAYTTPVRLDRQAGWELVISGGDYVTGHDPATGAEIWRLGGLNPGRHGMYRIVATPLVVGDKLIVPSRVSPLLVFAVPPAGPPELTWSMDRGTDVPAPTSDGNSLLVVNDRGILRRFDLATGDETSEPLRLPQGSYSGSPILAGDTLYVTNEEGTTAVVQTSGAPKVIAENATPGKMLASLAAADGRLFLRTADRLYCIGEPMKSSDDE